MEFTGGSARIVEEYHSDRADSITKAGGGIMFKKRAALTPDIVQWIMQFGSEARVREPRELADRIYSEAVKITQNYERSANGPKGNNK